MSATAQRSASPEKALNAESQTSIVTSPLARRVLAFSRIVIGFFFLWPFLDKTFASASPHRPNAPGSMAASQLKDSWAE